MVHSEYLPSGQTVNKDYYLAVVKHLRDAMRRKKPELKAENNLILHQDNTPPHKAKIVVHYLIKHSVNLLEQAPYSPDMAPCDFLIFLKLKMPLRGKRFEFI